MDSRYVTLFLKMINNRKTNPGDWHPLCIYKFLKFVKAFEKLIRTTKNISRFVHLN